MKCKSAAIPVTPRRHGAIPLAVFSAVSHHILLPGAQIDGLGAPAREKSIADDPQLKRDQSPFCEPSKTERRPGYGQVTKKQPCLAAMSTVKGNPAWRPPKLTENPGASLEVLAPIGLVPCIRALRSREKRGTAHSSRGAAWRPSPAAAGMRHGLISWLGRQLPVQQVE